MHNKSRGRRSFVRQPQLLKQLVDRNLDLLVRSLDPSNRLLIKLKSIAAIKRKLLAVEEQTTIEDKNYALLNILLEVSEYQEQSAINVVIEALKSSGQAHVANIFRRESDEVPMTEEHYELLSKNRVTVCQFLETRNGLLDFLVRDEVFTESNRSLVLSKSAVDAMAQQTVDILLRRPDSSFNKFISALNETGQSHVTHILTGVGKLSMPNHLRSLLTNKMKVLCQYLDPENGILVSLCSAEIITSFDANRIRAATGINEMAQKLIETLLRKNNDAFDALIKSLDDSGQKHVITILTGQGNSQPLSEEFRKKLTENRTNLASRIDSKYSGLVSALVSNGVFSEYDQQRVTGRKETTDVDLSEVIMDFIARKSQSDFEGFISALNKTGQKHVAIEFLGDEVVANILMNDTSENDAELESELLEHLQNSLEKIDIDTERLDEMLSSNGLSMARVVNGSIIVIFRCSSLQSLDNLQELYTSGLLNKLFSESFCPKFSERGLKSLRLNISPGELSRSRDAFTELKLITDGHREALELLVDKITISDDLLDKLSLCKRRRQAIERAATPKEKKKTLIDIISRRPDSAFTELLNALIATGQHDAAAAISDCDMTESNDMILKLQKSIGEMTWHQVNSAINELMISVFAKHTDCSPLCDLDDVSTTLRHLINSLDELSKKELKPCSRTFDTDSLLKTLQKLERGDVKALSKRRLQQSSRNVSSPGIPGQLVLLHYFQSYHTL